jgi:hypothetical protein
MLVRGAVDVVSSTEIRGWAYAPARHEPVVVQATLSHEVLGEAVANEHRPDLGAVGFGDGRCGYVIRLYRPIDPIYLPFVSVTLDGGDAELPRANASGFAEYFTALYRAHPAARRTRSVFGGLWTDRIDAAAVLRGRLDVGLLTEETAEPIVHLIHEGVALLRSLAPPARGFWTGTMAERIGAVLDDAALLGVLRAVLEDQPLVIRAEAIEGETMPFNQPSSGNPSPSPAECLAVVVPRGEEVAIEAVRESHRLPEFGPGGVSRWAGGGASVGLEMAVQHGVIDRIPVLPGSFAILAPGSLYRLRCAADSDAIQMLCLPARLTPLAVVMAESRRETVCKSGARIWI